MDYGCSSAISPDDERQEKWAKQREERGFDDTEIWNLDYTIVQFLYPRLKALQERKPLVHEMEPERLEALREMVEGFGLCESEDYWATANHDKLKRAFTLLSENFQWMWI